MESIKSPTRQIRSQLEALLHCKKCFTQPCATLNCEEFKAVIVHMEACKEGRACQGVHCASSRQIMRHWESCKNDSCVLCSPVRSSKLKFSSQDQPKTVSTDHAAGQNWVRKNTKVSPPAEFQSNKTSTENCGYYGNENRTDNLSDEMKLSIRDAVLAAMHNMLPQIEDIVRTAVRVEMATLLRGKVDPTNFTPAHAEHPVLLSQGYEQNFPEKDLEKQTSCPATACHMGSVSLPPPVSHLPSGPLHSAVPQPPTVSLPPPMPLPSLVHLQPSGSPQSSGSLPPSASLPSSGPLQPRISQSHVSTISPLRAPTIPPHPMPSPPVKSFLPPVSPSPTYALTPRENLVMTPPSQQSLPKQHRESASQLPINSSTTSIPNVLSMQQHNNGKKSSGSENTGQHQHLAQQGIRHYSNMDQHHNSSQPSSVTLSGIQHMQNSQSSVTTVINDHSFPQPPHTSSNFVRECPQANHLAPPLVNSQTINSVSPSLPSNSPQYDAQADHFMNGAFF